MHDESIDLNRFKAALDRLDPTAMRWVRGDTAARSMYDVFVKGMTNSAAWCREAESDTRITRWVPQGGGGDCFLVYPAETAAARAHGALDALTDYAYAIGRAVTARAINDAFVIAMYV